ncbi:PqqD family protein [Stackebrandtia endophytica]|uniref:PqqD family protein n=1 Tax=Stackebrandtia endophytica TaxID=1496996 RepID=UPI00147736BC|nr:PqqD family protein [Stackebrandtia endophytica]
MTIGDIDREVYLSIPPPAFELLEWLKSGDTVAEAVRRFEAKFNETPEVEDFLAALAAEGFITPASHTPPTDETPPTGAAPAPRRARKTHFDRLTPTVARRIFGRPFVIVCGLIVAVGITLVAIDPGVMPGPNGLRFEENFAAMTWLTFLIALVGVYVHEVAHVIAARAAGSPARIEISNRMYVPVAQTDMTGIWMADKSQRYLGFLAGPIIDAASLSIIIVFLWLERRGDIALSSTALMLLRGVGFTYLARLIWQTLLFWRTDFYYSIATLLGCKNLMIDTENYLRNLVARVRRRALPIDQSDVPSREMRSVRVYSFLYVGGRVVAVWALVTITFPLMWFYLTQSATYLTGDNPGFGLLDFTSAIVLGIGLNLLGLVLWGRNLYRAWSRRRAS